METISTVLCSDSGRYRCLIALLLFVAGGGFVPGCSYPQLSANCGDGVVEYPEECDDGNRVDNDGCSNACLPPACGDGILQGGEQCDDGNADSSDACTTDCVDARCGDGWVQTGIEACDDANFDNNDGCLNNCTLARCGDGYVRVGVELCDDGNTVGTDGCRNDCAPASCGDGIVQSGEQCDDGNTNNADACLVTCVSASCGDGFVQTGVEACDDGNRDVNDACVDNCLPATCGDGYIWLGVEACDDGNTNNNDACRNDCVPATCGDGVVQAPELCDDGNTNDSDACLHTCVEARCGDGHLFIGVEACDDGNLVAGDGCRPTCKMTPACGNGIREAAEECDDGNGDNSDSCLVSCRRARCGDGYQHLGIEACDDGNDIDEDSCPTTCEHAICGDGFIYLGVESCDDGNSSNADACLTTCESARCGDGVVNAGVELCDDGNLDNTDGCLIDCRIYDPCLGFSIDTADVVNACLGGVPAQITLQGSGILRVNGVDPMVMVDGVTTTVASIAGCSPLSGVFNTVEECSSLTIDMPAGLITGVHPIVVTSPTTALCSDQLDFGVGPAPSITSVSPANFCSNASQVVDVFGSDFLSTSVVLAGGVQAFDTQLIVPGQLRATFQPPLAAGPHDITVSNGVGCTDTLFSAIDVFDPALVLFVDPAVTWNGADAPVTVFAANVNVPMTEVAIALTGSGNPPTPLSFTPQAAHPDRPDAIVPAATVAGSYDVWFTDTYNCQAVLPGALTVTATTDLALASITPDFGWTSSKTAVTITATGLGFDAFPRAYLLAPGSTSPNPLLSLSRLSATVLSAEVPAGLEPTTAVAPIDYDVVVVNQDGTVGILLNSFTVSFDPPPVVSFLTPSLVPNSAGQSVAINGQSFRTPDVVLRCVDPAGARYPDQTSANGLTVDSSTATTIDITFNGAAYTAANCVVRVTNGDGTRAQFSSLVVITPNVNLTGFVTGPDLNTARRRLGSASGNASASARFVYVAAGDDGTAALATVEVLPVDIFGLPSVFFEQQNQLITARSQLGTVRIGRFIYAVGGTDTMDDATGALNTVERAAILDLSFHPDNLDVDIDLAATGVGGGVHLYRVAAVMPSNDPFNPSGETLPSAPFGMQLPTLAGYGLQVALSWDAVVGAVGYRIYRESDASGDGLLADTTLALPPGVTCSSATSCTDAGATPDTSVVPLRPGATGRWQQLTQTMATARQGAGVTWALDPVDAPFSEDCWQGLRACTAYLYVMGGLDAGGTPLASSEFLTIATGTDGSQDTSGGFAATAALGAARWRLGGYALSPSDTSWVGADSYVWAGGGATNSGSTAITDLFEGARVQAGGQLTAFAATSVQQPQTAGYGTIAFGNLIAVLGGATDAGPPTVENGVALGTGAPPALGNFQNFDPGLDVPRADPGSAVQSGYFYAIGGTTTGNAVTPSTEYVLY